MPCNVKYKCRPSFGPLHHHNVEINGEKWHKIGRENPPVNSNDIVDEITKMKCVKKDLKMFGYEEGWIHDCK